MFARFFQKQPLLHDEAVEMLFDLYAWCFERFGAAEFQNRVLVLPNNHYFPGTEQTAEGMAALILERVKDYAGVPEWPLRAENGFSHADDALLEDQSGSQGRVVFYNPQQLANPQALIANYAHHLAHYLAMDSASPPPGDETQWLQATEVVAIFLGFGLMFANTALAAPRSCASCRPPGMDRQGALSQYEATYALAIFCTLKGLDEREVSANLKKTLRSFFKRAVNELHTRHTDQLEMFKALAAAEHSARV